MYTHKIVDGVEVALTPEEIAELEARDTAWAQEQANKSAAATPTKEQLMAELAALTAKIQSLE